MRSPRTGIITLGVIFLFLSIILRWHEINFSFEAFIIWFVVSSAVQISVRESKIVLSDFYYGLSVFATDVLPLCCLFIFYNPHMHVIGIYMLLTGWVLNSLVRMANKTKMPCRTTADRITEKEIYIPMNVKPGLRTRINILGDWIPSYMGLMSPGDILLYSGPYIVAIQFLFWL